MSRSSTLILIGTIIVVVSFIGIPLHWVRFVLPLLGLAIIVIGFLIRSDRVAALKRDMPEPPTPTQASVSLPAAQPNELSPIA